MTGRSLSLLDPTYASKYIPIIASVSEHQPPSWPSYFTDLQARPPCLQGLQVFRQQAFCSYILVLCVIPITICVFTAALMLVLYFQCLYLQVTNQVVSKSSDIASRSNHTLLKNCSSPENASTNCKLVRMVIVQAATLLMPAGLIAAFRPLTHASLFLVLYGVTAIYFSGVMVRTALRTCVLTHAPLVLYCLIATPLSCIMHNGMRTRPAESCAYTWLCWGSNRHATLRPKVCIGA